MFPDFYNNESAHSGYPCHGKTSFRTFSELPEMNLKWIRVGRSGRRKAISRAFFLKTFGLSFSVIFLTLFCLTLYSPWILYRNPTWIEKEWFPNPFTFIKINWDGVIQENLSAATNVIIVREPPEKSSIPSLHIFIQNNGMEILDNQNFLFHLGRLIKRPKIKGSYKTKDGKLVPIAISIRGTHRWHHQIWKPSLKIRFKKSQIEEGFRDHLLVAPEDGIGLRNWLSTELSKKWGMLNYGEHFARLFINNKNMGIYNRLWRLDESLLIRNHKIPGPFFRFEFTIKREFLKKKEKWFIPPAWEAIGLDDRNGSAYLNAPIKTAQNILDLKIIRNKPQLIRNLSTLNHFIDRESFAKYLALICHSGSMHVDDYHNNTFWLDVASGKFVPILTDINGYDIYLTGHGLKLAIIKKEGAFVQAWLKDPINFALYIDKTFELINSIGSYDKTKYLIEKNWKKIRADLLSDIHYSAFGSIQIPRKRMPLIQLDQNLSALIDFVEKRNSWISQRLQDDKLYITRSAENKFKILVDGLAGFKARRKDGKKINGEAFVELLPSVNSSNSKRNLLPIPSSYAFYHLPGKPGDYEFSHRLTGEQRGWEQYPHDLRILKKMAGINPLDIPASNLDPVVLGPGNVEILNTLTFEPRQPVTIRAGTKLFLGPGVSLIIQGRLLVEGTKANPVKVLPLEAKSHFGSFAILGKETVGSRIHHIDVERGSVAKIHNLNLTGMFSIHDSPDIEIINSRFGRNFIGDDAVHIVRSKVKIKNVVFEDALFDALDLDKVEAEISNAQFLKPGNDGVDFSMGQAKLSDSTFHNCGDKCISAGEGARVVITGSRFSRGKVGVAVKDRSRVELKDSLFTGNVIAYNSYRKKWRWEKGGEGVIENTRFLDSEKADIAGDKYSRAAFPKGLPQNLNVEGEIVITRFPKD